MSVPAESATRIELRGQTGQTGLGTAQPPRCSGERIALEMGSADIGFCRGEAVGGTMIRVLVAEDMRILRDMLVSMLNLEDDIKVVAQVADGAVVVPAALAERPDLAVLDIDMPEVDGLTAAAELHKQLPACRVVILTVLGRPGQLRQALSAHVSGFLVKD